LANALVMGLATLLVDMGTTGFNTFFDYWRGTDNIVHTKEQEKVLVHEGVSPFMALLVSLVLFGVAALLGLYLAWMTSWKLILVGGACMLVAFSKLQDLSPFQELRWESCLPAFLEHPFSITLCPGCPSHSKKSGDDPSFLCTSPCSSVNNAAIVGDTATVERHIHTVGRQAFALIAFEGLEPICSRLWCCSLPSDHLAFCCFLFRSLCQSPCGVKKAGSMPGTSPYICSEFQKLSALCLDFSAYVFYKGFSALASEGCSKDRVDHPHTAERVNRPRCPGFQSNPSKRS
jgi:1,4-dihydroxy-2-naphthoate octaprenyltransferase